MNIQKIAIIVLMCTSTIGFANQINMNNVRTVSDDRIKSEVSAQEEGDIDGITDFGTMGELTEEDLKQPLWLVIANKIVSPFFVMYNWLHRED